MNPMIGQSIGTKLYEDYKKRSEKSWKFWNDSLPDLDNCSEETIKEWERVNEIRRDQEIKQVSFAYKLLNFIIVSWFFSSIVLFIGGVALMITTAGVFSALGVICFTLGLFLTVFFFAFYTEDTFMKLREFSFQLADKRHPSPELPEFAKGRNN